MIDEILDLSKSLIKIKSDPENEIELENALNVVKSKLNEFTIEEFEQNNSKSILVYNSKKRPKKFKIILNGHLDVIPGKDYQYSPVVKDNKLYGVGALDMKSNLSCLILAFRDLAKKINYPLGLQIVTDEEVGGMNGTKFQIEKGVRADFVIAGETTQFNIANQAKGVLWVKIHTKGKTAHGAYPWKGENAIWKMHEFIEKLKEAFPIPKDEKWETTVNLSKIETSNTHFNKIPDDASVSLDIRFIPKDKKIILSKIKSLLPQGFKLEIILNEPELFVDEKNLYLQLLKKVSEDSLKKKIKFYGANGSSDARHFTRVKNSGVEFGPIGGGIGTDNEWTDIKGLENYYQIICKFLLEAEKL